MVDEIPPAEESPTERKRLNSWLIVALVAAVAAGVLLASSVWEGSWKGDSADGNEAAQASLPDLQSWCAAQASYDAIRNELFRRAAQVRGGDEQAYARLADYAMLRISGPLARDTDEDLRSVSCSGAATLDLPPGVAAAGGRRSLAGDIEYMIQPAADGTGNVIRLGNADAIVVPLATLSRRGGPQGAPLQVPELPRADLGDEQQQQPPVQVEEPQAPEPREQEPAPQPRTASPSFNCGNARTRGEIAVCGDPGLAALDRQMASQFNSALSRADSQQRALLQRTRGTFLRFRDRCGNNQCIAESYRGRMREISDIMAGRWRG